MNHDLYIVIVHVANVCWSH